MAIDPQPDESAWVVYGDGEVHLAGIDDNRLLLERCRQRSDDGLVVTMPESFGQPVSRVELERAVLAGRFIEAFGNNSHLLRYSRVKLFLCNSVTVTDEVIHHTLVQRWGGKRKSKEFLRGVRYGAWRALALAVTWVDGRGFLEDIGELNAANS